MNYYLSQLKYRWCVVSRCSLSIDTIAVVNPALFGRFRTALIKRVLIE